MTNAKAYYNEHNKKAAAWLRELISQNLVAPGDVDDRSITEVKAIDLAGYTQCHFFAGIGGWSYALRLAGWPDDCPVWTGSCPCQPFSCAGKRKGTRDARHLFPVWKNLIAQRVPSVVFGEQVASKAGRLWLSRVRAEMEALAYAVGAADLCAAGVSAPHLRQRLFWVADSHSSGSLPGSPQSEKWNSDPLSIGAGQGGGGLDNSSFIRRPTWRQDHTQNVGLVTASNGEHGFGLGHANGYHSHWWSGPLQMGWNCCEAEIERSGRKYRAQWRLKPGLPLLADGVPGRVDQICGFGNAIVPQLAAEFIISYLEARNIG